MEGQFEADDKDARRGEMARTFAESMSPVVERFVPRIRVRTLILTSRDDPLVPIAPFEKLNLPESVSLLMTDHGGHLGYIAKHGIDPDRRWLDWRVIDWATSPCDLIAAC